MQKTQRGVGILPALLIVVIIGIIGFTGWFVWKSTHATERSLSSAPTLAATSGESVKKPQPAAKKTVALKEYANEEYGFSFKYPEDWKLAVGLKDIGRGDNEGDVTVMSPAGTIVTFNANMGGKGGDCWDDQANDRTTRTCQTRTIETVEKLPVATGSTQLFYYQASLKQAERNGGEVEYFVGLLTDEFGEPEKGSLVGIFANMISANKGYVNFSVKGPDFERNDTKEYLKTREVQEASAVLKTFALNKKVRGL